MFGRVYALTYIRPLTPLIVHCPINFVSDCLFFNSRTASMRVRSFCLRFMPRFYSFSELQLTFMFFYRSLKPFDGEFYVVYIALTHIRFYDRLFNGIFELNVRHHILNECVVRWHKPNQFVCLENIFSFYLQQIVAKHSDFRTRKKYDTLCS